MTLLRHISVLTGLLFLLAAGGTVRGDDIQVDVELVIAVDASGSISRAELQLQFDGIAAAVRDQTIQQAVAQGLHRQVIISMLVWSDAGYSKHTTPWYVLNSPATFEAFAGEVENFRESISNFSFLGGGGTNIGDALAYALDMLEHNNAHSPRRIVDISGDGPETIPWFDGSVLLPQARKMAEAQRVVVNGLAIETDVVNLGGWYRRNLITGPGSFVMVAKDFEDFRRAIRRKLFRELSPVFMSQIKDPVAAR